MADERVMTFDPTMKIQALVAESDVALVGAGIKSSANGLVLRPAADSTTGVRVQTAAGGATSIAIDTVNHRMFVGGSTAPTARLHLAAGAAGVGSAPLKIASGTALTTPEDGALEYHSSHLYFTVGSTRYQLDGAAAASHQHMTGSSLLIGPYVSGSISGDSNVGVGPYAFQSLTSGQHNVGVGYETLQQTTTTSFNTAVGSYAGGAVKGEYNVAIGRYALFGHPSNNTGSSNVAVGARALYSLAGGQVNVAIGTECGYALTTGGENTIVGDKALYSCQTGYWNVAIGRFAAYYITTGANVAVGASALYGAAGTTASENVGVGANAGGGVRGDMSRGVFVGHNSGWGTGATGCWGNTGVGWHTFRQGLDNAGGGTTGSWNTAVGSDAFGSARVSGSNNTGIGAGALYRLTSGVSNTAVGYQAAQYVTSGYSNVLIGYNASAVTETGFENVVVGAGAGVGGSNPGLYGATVVGFEASVTGTQAISVGYRASVSGNTGIAIGAPAGGTSTTAVGVDSIALGTAASAHTTESTAIGWRATCSGSGTQAIAIGKNATATNIHAIAIGAPSGANTTAAGYDSIAIGSGSYAGTNDNVAIGYQAFAHTTGGNIQLGQGTNNRATRSLQVGVPGTITYSCYATSWINTPSRRAYKHNITSLSAAEGLQFVLKLDPIHYTVDSDEEFHRRPRFGFTIEQVQEVVEELQWGYAPSLYDDISETGAMEYSQFVVPLVKAVQELAVLVKDLQQANASLLARIEGLEAKQL